jgi:PAS domain S-box-containing protein
MSKAAAWSDQFAGNLASGQRAAVKRALWLSVLILAAAGALAVWTLHCLAHSIAVPSGHLEPVTISAAAIAILGVLACFIPPFVSAAISRRNAVEQVQEKASHWQNMALGLQHQLSLVQEERNTLVQGRGDLQEKFKKMEEEVRTLGAAKTRAQEELDRRNRSERALSQRRQELENSKNVLELHVQARTQELHTLKQRHELILDSAGEGICGLDMEGRASFVNPTVAKLTGWPVTELVGKTEQEIFLYNGQGAAVTFGKLNPGEQIFYRKDGAAYPVELVRTPLTENGRTLGTVLVFKDITERKRAEDALGQRAAELARSNAELEQFAFVASHDLQEPLRKIQAFGDRLKVKCEGQSSHEVQDYLVRMQGAAARMRTLIDDLLTFSRVIRSAEPFAPVDLGQVTREVLSDLEVNIEKRGAKVEVGTLPTVEADALQMRQLLLNLLSNALKFQPAGASPLIRIEARTLSAVSGEQLCELSVEDNGIGFDEKYLEKIFAVFQRLHGRSEFEGTGVGLAVCRRIVDRHHGTITAKSKPGQGATFVVTLPLRQSNPDTSK